MHIDTHQQDHTLTISLAGDWTLKTPLPRFTLLFDELQSPSTVQAVSFNTEELGYWDSSLLVFLLEGLEFCASHNIQFQQESLPENISALIGLSQAVPEKKDTRSDKRTGFVTAIGQAGLSLFSDVMDFIHFFGTMGHAIFRVLTFRARVRWRDFWVIFQSNSVQALPIVTLISFLVGLIIAFLGVVVLQRFGAGYYVSYIVSYGVLRELGALMTAIIMAGRTGAAFAAELGSMKISDEINALDTLGISPVDFLVLPRFLAIFFSMPLLTLYANFVAILGGMMVATSMLDLNVTQFMKGLLEPVTLNDALLGLIKASVFGAIVGISGCLRGMQTGKDASAVGMATTSAVVTAITLIILANAFLDWLAAITNF